FIVPRSKSRSQAKFHAARALPFVQFQEAIAVSYTQFPNAMALSLIQTPVAIAVSTIQSTAAIALSSTNPHKKPPPKGKAVYFLIVLSPELIVFKPFFIFSLKLS